MSFGSSQNDNIFRCTYREIRGKYFIFSKPFQEIVLYMVQCAVIVYIYRQITDNHKGHTNFMLANEVL